MSCGGQERAGGLGSGEEVAQPSGRGHTHIGPVPEGSIEGLAVGQKQLLDVTQAGDLKDLWLLLNHLPGEQGQGQGREPRRGSSQRMAGSGDRPGAGLAWAGSGPALHPPPGAVDLYGVGELPVQSGEEAAGRQQDGAHGEATAALAHPLQVCLGEVSHADGPCRAVQELVPISGGGTEPSGTSHPPFRPLGFSQLSPTLGFWPPNPEAFAGKGLRTAEPGLRGGCPQ